LTIPTTLGISEDRTFHGVLAVVLGDGGKVVEQELCTRRTCSTAPVYAESHGDFILERFLIHVLAFVLAKDDDDLGFVRPAPT